MSSSRGGRRELLRTERKINTSLRRKWHSKLKGNLLDMSNWNVIWDPTRLSCSMYTPKRSRSLRWFVKLNGKDINPHSLVCRTSIRASASLAYGIYRGKISLKFQHSFQISQRPSIFFKSKTICINPSTSLEKNTYECKDVRVQCSNKLTARMRIIFCSRAHDAA